MNKGLLYELTDRTLFIGENGRFKNPDITDDLRKIGTDGFVYLANVHNIFVSANRHDLAEPYKKMLDYLTEGNTNELILRAFLTSPNTAKGLGEQYKSVNVRSNPYGNLKSRGALRSIKQWGIFWSKYVSNIGADLGFMIYTIERDKSIPIAVADRPEISETAYAIGAKYSADLVNLILEHRKNEFKILNPSLELTNVINEYIYLAETGKNIGVVMLERAIEKGLISREEAYK